MDLVQVDNLIKDVQTFTKDEITDIIFDIQKKIEESGEKLEVPIEHYFSKGVYAREMKLKAGNIIVGKIHKFENLNILSEGEVLVLSIDGGKRVKAPHTFVGSPGSKRVIYALTDVTWTTIHGTEEKDVEKIEETFIAKDYSELNLEKIIETKEQKCLG